MKQVLDFLNECGVYYLATVEGDQPRVRPFGAACIFDDKLYLVTNNTKLVYKQLMANPKVEVCGMAGGKWIRLSGELVRDDRREARVAMLAANEASLGKLYTVDDGIMEVFYFKNATATFYSFSEEPKSVSF